MMDNILRCLVKIPKGKTISYALDFGFAVNLYCAEGYMWVSLPNVTIDQMEEMIQYANLEKISEIEQRC